MDNKVSDMLNYARVMFRYAVVFCLSFYAQIATAAIFTANAHITADDTTYDGQDVEVRGVTVTIDGAHSFNSLKVTQNGVVTTSSASTMTVPVPLNMTVTGTVTIDAGSSIDVSTKGNLRSATNTTSGGSYGGYGGVSYYQYIPEPTHGDYRMPVDFGSGGHPTYVAAAGGGSLKLSANELILNGAVLANGGAYNSSGGSGGSIWIDVNIFSGIGTVSANGAGGRNAWSYYSGGGGGRVAVYYNDASNFDLINNISANGGHQDFNAYIAGTPGTIYLKAATDAVGELRIVDSIYRNSITKTEISTYTDKLVLTNIQATISAPLSLTSLIADGSQIATSGHSVVASDTIALANVSVFGVSAVEQKLDITVGTVIIDATSYIDVSGKGKRLTTYTEALSSGGSYGGLGGNPNATYPGAKLPTYGDYRYPADFGTGDYYNTVGYSSGGGAVKIIANEFILDGNISANGSNSSRGGGSGGSVWLELGVLSGTGNISANGGDGGYSGGGGGRIAIYYGAANAFDFKNNVTTFGGRVSTQSTVSGQPGGAGTIYLKSANEATGEVRISSREYSNISAGTELPTTIAGSVVVEREKVITVGQTNLAALYVDNGEIKTDGTSLTVQSTLALNNNSLMGVTAAEQSMNVTADVFSIDSTSSINVAGMGRWPDATVANYCGGSHGGSGGLYLPDNSNFFTNSIFGDYRQPLDFGMGGKAIYNTSYYTRGGGVVHVTTNELVLDGNITATGSGTSYGGGGSGGSIWLDTNVIRGVGNIDASGGAAGHGGGGGGRVAVYYAESSGFDLYSHVIAYGGASASSAGQSGGAGTVYLKNKDDVNGELRFVSVSLDANAPVTELSINSPERISVKNIQVVADVTTNLAALTVDGGIFAVNGAALATTGSLIVKNSGHLLSSLGQPLELQSFSILIDGTSSLSVTGNGNPPTTDVSVFAGGSYGGLGGTYSTWATNSVYGDEFLPTDLGTGGRSQNGAANDSYGGGALKLVADDLQLDGKIEADGGYNSLSGGGSGGSIWLDVGVISGIGSVSADGAAGGVTTHDNNCGGGGGRVAVYSVNSGGFDLQNKITANGGVGQPLCQSGQPGTIYLGAKTAPPFVISHMPDGLTNATVDSVTLRFSNVMNLSSMTPSQIIVTDGSGITYTPTIVQLTSTNYGLNFTPSLPDNDYIVTIGSGVTDINGITLDQNRNGIFNEAADVYTFSFSVDTSPPGAVTVDNYLATPASNVIAASRKITLSGTRPANTYIWINGIRRLNTGAGSTAWALDMTLDEGANTLAIQSGDAAGNLSKPVVIDFMVDTITPVTGAVQPIDGSYLSDRNPVINIGYTETGMGLDLNQSIYTVSLNGVEVAGAWSNVNSSLVFTPALALADGAYTIDITLIDNAGHVALPHVSSFIVDTVAPVAPVLTVAPTSTTINTEIFRGEKEVDSGIIVNGYAYNLDSGATWSASVPLITGSNDVTFAIRDRAGNVSPEVVHNIVYDNVAPGPVPVVTRDYGDGTRILLTWADYNTWIEGNDIDHYDIYVETEPFTDVVGLTPKSPDGVGTKSAVFNLVQDQLYYFAVVAVDTAGNSLTSVTPVTATPTDTTAPGEASNLVAQPFIDQLVVSWQASPNASGDLSGYRLYLDGTLAVEVAPDVLTYTLTALTPGTGYQLILRTVDSLGNESAGISLAAATLLPNPNGITTTPFSGKVKLDWQPVLPTNFIKNYAIYVSQTDFVTVEGMTPTLLVDNATTSAFVAGLTNNVPYYFAITTINVSDGESKTVITVTDIPQPDTSGPAITEVLYDGGTLNDGDTLTRSAMISLAANDPSGVGRVVFKANGQILGSDANGNDGYGVGLDLLALTDGPLALELLAYDTLDNVTSLTRDVLISLSAPTAPIVTEPQDGLISNETTINVVGSSEKNSQITLYQNDVEVATTVADNVGSFQLLLTLQEGTNTLTATASNRGGTSALSTPISVILDSSIPEAPTGLSATSSEQGKISLAWFDSPDTRVVGYDVYRYSAPFDDINLAVKANSALLTASSYDDIPMADGQYYYRVVARNSLGTASLPSPSVSAVSDSTAPRALSIAYVPEGAYDPVNKIIGNGKVGVTVTLNEPLLTTPFLSISPQGGIPLLVDLVKVDELTYSGSFTVTADTLSGTAYAVFSARDAAGNRGTEVDVGSTLQLDTSGPSVTKLAILPLSPIKNDSVTPVSVTVEITLDQPVKPGSAPDFAYQLSGVGRLPVPISMTAVNDTTFWRGDFVLPGDAGATDVETLSFTFSSVDALANIGTSINDVNLFQVYQGNLPPLTAPTNLQAIAKPGGKVTLTWDAVPQAVAYQVSRQGPGEVTPTPLQRVATTTLDDAVTDGLYIYTVASVRNENGQEAISGPSNAVTVNADSIAPSAPEGLVLQLIGAGIQATWQPPIGLTETVTYNLYRNSGTSLVDITGLSPVKAGITADVNGQLSYIDPNPSVSEPTYAVTAVDAAGNESPPSISQYLNLDLLPVNSLSVNIPEAGYPQVAWTHSGGNITAYRIYLDGSAQPVTETNSTSYEDLGYTSGERSYTVTAIDVNGKESIGRTVQISMLDSNLSPQSVIKRGIFNQLTYAVKNNGAIPQTGVSIESTVADHTHHSVVVSVGAGDSLDVPVVVGGYQDLPGLTTLTTLVNATSATGETVSRHYSRELAVSDSKLLLAIETKELQRGAIGQVRFTLQNPSAVDTEIVTALNNGNKASNEIRIQLRDVDGNLIATQDFQQNAGNNISTRDSGARVATVPGGGSFTTDWFALNVPYSAPDGVTVEVIIDQFHYHVGMSDHVAISGMTGSRVATLLDTSYMATVDSITPSQSYGGEPVVITGQAIDSTTSAVMPNVPVLIVVSANGFERSMTVTTDFSGKYSYNFMAMEGESGDYTVSAIHPDVVARPGQGAFSVHKVLMTPDVYRISQPYTSTQQYNNVRVSTGLNTAVTGLRLELDNTTLPNGLILTLPDPVNLNPGQNVSLPFILEAGVGAPAAGSIPLKLMSDTSGTRTLDQVQLDFTLSEASPVLKFSPTFVDTGVVHGGSVSETITLSNSGLGAMNDVSIRLLTDKDSAIPDWIYLTSDSNAANMAIGAERDVSFTVAPDATVAEGNYGFKVRVLSSNYPVTDVNVQVAVTQSGIGNVLFKASDIYTATLDVNGNPIPGLSGARIRVQNELVLSVEQTLTTDAYGEVLFKDLPAGSYLFRASATNHEDAMGRFTIKPGVTENREIFLDYSLITVEWNVTDTTVPDTYEVVLNTTYETDVPAAVLVTQPSSVTLPDMQVGEVFYGTFRLTNYGLIRADNITFNLPGEDSYFRYEFPEGLPTTLLASESVEIPYRVISVATSSPDATASGGGTCYGYGNSASIAYSYDCMNGYTSYGEAGFSWSRTVSGNCDSVVWTHTGNGTSSSSPSTSPPTNPIIGQSCPLPCDEGSCACKYEAPSKGGQ